MSDQPIHDPNAQQRIQVQLDDQVAQGIYANMAMLSHTENEFVLDFIFVPPTRQPSRVRSRIIVSPRQAKRLARTLSEAVARYEETHGNIPESSAPDAAIH